MSGSGRETSFSSRPVADIQAMFEIALMDTLEDLKLDREHVTHLLY